MLHDLTKYLSYYDETQNQFAYLIENLPAAFYTCDVQGHILLYNKAAALLWGAEPVFDKDLWCGPCNLYDADGVLLSPGNSPMALAIREQKPVMAVETIIKRPDGNKQWL